MTYNENDETLVKNDSIEGLGGGDKQEIILFGTGGLAKRFYSKYKDIIDIKFCIDNDKNKIGSKFYEHNIYNIYEKRNDIKKYKIIVASSYYSEISSQLYKLKLEEYENFISHENFSKKMAIVYGNCHATVIKSYLENSKLFSSKYFIMEIPNIHKFENDYDCIDEKILENCNLFIYQYSSRNNKFGYQLSSEYILSLLSKRCNCINIPNLYCEGSNFLFPQVKDIFTNNPFNNNTCCRQFAYADENIDILIKQNKGVEEICNILKSTNFYNKSYISQNFDKNISLLEERDKKFNVKVVDYIKDNYDKFLTYYDVAHPTNIVLKEIGRRILKLLELYSPNDYDKIELSTIANRDANQIPIYPSVAKHLDLKFDTNLIRKHHSLGCNNRILDFEDYIREYIKWCYNIEE